MRYILLIFLMNGNDGGHIAWTQVEFDNKSLCERAKEEYLSEHKTMWKTDSFRPTRAFCFKVRE